MRNKRGDVETDFPVYIGIALLILIILGVGYLILKGNLSGTLDHLKNLFRFGK